MEQETPGFETVIRYSTLHLIGYLLVSVVIQAGALYPLLTQRPLGGGAFLFGVVASIGCPLVICRYSWLLFRNPPQLTLSVGGIRLASGPLDSWQAIQDEEVQKVRDGRGTSSTFLRYSSDSQERRFNIGGLAISSAQLTLLLQHYRAQFLDQRNQ